MKTTRKLRLASVKGNRANSQRDTRQRAAKSRRRKRQQSKRWEGKPVPHVPKVIEAKVSLKGEVE